MDIGNFCGAVLSRCCPRKCVLMIRPGALGSGPLLRVVCAGRSALDVDRVRCPAGCGSVSHRTPVRTCAIRRPSRSGALVPAYERKRSDSTLSRLLLLPAGPDRPKRPRAGPAGPDMRSP